MHLRTTTSRRTAFRPLLFDLRLPPPLRPPPRAAEASKAGRATVLTTHSMEEADILGDKIGIMARGRLRAVGPSLRLKQRFGAGYSLSVLVALPKGAAPDPAALAQRADAVRALFKVRQVAGAGGRAEGWMLGQATGGLGLRGCCWDSRLPWSMPMPPSFTASLDAS